jgi:hypothetical protein
MEAKLITAGCDWLTLTTKDKARQQEWREAFDAVSMREQTAGWKQQPMTQRGYVGKQIGHLFVGFYEGIGLARISSSWANEYGYWFSPDGVNCTRCDLQATWELGHPIPGKMREWYNAARIVRPRNGHPSYFRWIENSEGGTTLEVGRRVSARMGRVYDKGREQNIAPAGHILRWEVEFKEELANQAVAGYFAANNPEGACIQTLAAFFEEKSIPYPQRSGDSAIKLTSPKDLPDVADTLRWLSGPVAKAVARSVGWVGMNRTLSAVLVETLQENSDADTLLAMLSNILDD